jgi:hypothetical protein
LAKPTAKALTTKDAEKQQLANSNWQNGQLTNSNWQNQLQRLKPQRARRKHKGTARAKTTRGKKIQLTSIYLRAEKSEGSKWVGSSREKS